MSESFAGWASLKDCIGCNRHLRDAQKFCLEMRAVHKRACEEDERKRIRKVISTPAFQTTRFDATLAAFRKDVSEYHGRTHSEDNDMDPVQKMQSVHKQGGDPGPDDVQSGVEHVGELIYQRDRSLTREQALAKAFEQPLFPFRAADAQTNPTWAMLYRRAGEAAIPPERRATIEKAASDEAAAWARLEAVAERIRAKDPSLTKPASIAKALTNDYPEGVSAYRDYTAAQAAARRAKRAQ